MRHRVLIVVACLLCGITLALTGLDSGRNAIAITNAASTTITDCPTTPNIGCKDQAFPLNPSKSDFSPTGEKPQSKLWYNDGRWWASMLNTAADNHYYIFYLSGQTWVKTNTQLDPRPQTQADCLWDSVNHKLYVVSGAGVVPSGVDLNAQLFRYSYNPANPPETAYTLDSGFPATIRTGGAETVVLDKDSQGHLWITYTQNNKVWVSHSTSADNFWSMPFNPAMPAALTSGITVGADDISSLVAFNGKIGVVWSNQNDSTFYYAIHADGNGDSTWQSGIILHQTGIADDHINLKSVQTDGGNIFAVVKTSLDNGGVSDPRMIVLRRDPTGTWSSTVFIHEKEGTTQTPYTRAILLIDSANHRLYVFATTTDTGGTIIYKRSTDYTVGGLSFPSGFGTGFIKIGGLGAINNATSTKQTVDGTSGIVVLASDGTFRFYVHNVILLTNPPTTPTPTQIPHTPTPTPSPTATPRPDTHTHLYLPLLFH
jgi:hypothetical protein